MLGSKVLEQLRLDSPEDDPSTVQLWPEHFDVAVEIGNEARGERAAFGVSPGDAAHDAPYAYVSAWADVDRTDPFWNDTAFPGASLGYETLRASTDPESTLADFYREGIAALSRRRQS